jgi:hypothetical protein
MKIRSFISFCVAAACVVAWLGVAGAKEAEEKPSATITLKSKAVAAGVGFSWGSGTLHYKGHDYPLKIDGLTAGSVGASSVEASGEVYNLKKLADFDGNYTAVTGAATLGGGGGGLVMQNQNGVKVHLVSTTRGISLTAGVSGVKLAIKK